MEDDKVDTGTNGNIPNSSILISNEEDANRTMTPLIVTSDEDSFDVKNLNKNVKLTATKKDNKNIKNLEDDIKEIFGERSTDKISKSSKIKNQRKSISSTGSGGGGGCSSVASSNKSSNNKNSKSPTRIQKNSPIIKSIKNEVISEPSTSSNLSSIGKRCYNEIDKFLSSLKTAPNENEYLYGFDANGKPVYGPLAKKIKGENKDDEENIENDKMQLYSNEEKPLVTIQKAQEISEKICDTTTTSPEEFNISKTSTFVETEIIEEEAPEQNVLNDNQNDKEDIVHEKLEIPSTPPPSFIPSSTAKSSESPTSTATPTTAQTNNSNTSKLKPSEDPIYRKPFELGWKREIVLRALPGSKDKGEVYYITPNGKKLRTRNEILSHLTIGLSMDNFTFSKDPLGANPDEEIIRSAKITGRTSTDIVLGKRIPKPKAPKGASPPPQHQSSSSTTTQNWSYNSNKSKSSSSIDRHHHHHQHNSSSGSSPRTISNTRISEDNSSGTNTKLSSKISSSKSSKKHDSGTSSSSGLQTGDCLSSSASKKRTSSGHQSGTSSSTHSAPVKIQKVDTFANNFFGNVSLGYDVLLQIFQYLKVQELLRAACVCRVWNVVANHRSLWKTVRMKNSQVNDWSGLAASLRRNETKHLDLRKMLCLNSTEDQMWSNFAEHIKSVITLQKIDLGRCSSNVVQNLFLTTPQLRYLNAISIRSDTLNLNNLNLMNNLEELRLKTNDGCNLDGDLTPLELLINLRHLSLTSINELGLKNINILGNLINLESLEIGECSQLNEQFAIHILPKLIKLERLRLEKSTETNVTFELLKTISEMNNLLQLELVNFDIRDGFESKIIECKYLKRLLLIPTYISQSATTNQIILSSMRKLTTLDSLTWVVTMELLRVTALYVDQCEEVTKGKKTFDESIPVLKPVPGTNYIDDDNINKQSSDVQQVEILPLSKIREILADGMPNTKFKIVKVAYHATWRQNYVE